VRDDCITVAVEEMPEEGLDQPLRLDKLANEVPSQAHMAYCRQLVMQAAMQSCRKHNTGMRAAAA
jgi:hypothetical protein